MSKFLDTNIVRSLEFTLRQINCSDLMPMECAYPNKMNVLDDVTRTISHFAMMYSADYLSYVQIDRAAAGLYENKDYYLELHRIRESLKDKPILQLRQGALPVLLNLIYSHRQTAYVSARGEKDSLLRLGIEIIDETSHDNWPLNVMHGLLIQRRGEACRSKSDLEESTKAFRSILGDGKNKSRLDINKQTLVWLWLGRSQALLYAWGDDKVKELMKRELPETVANLDRVQVDWTKGARRDDPPADVLKARFETQRIALRGVNDRMKSPTNDILAGLDIVAPEFCPR